LALTDSGIYSTDSLERGAWRNYGSDVYGKQAGADRARPFELSDTNISALAFDENQNLWVGYFERGLDVFDSRGKRLLHHEDDRIFCVNHFLSLPDGRMAVATANGLAVYHGMQLRHFITEKQGLIHKAVAMTHALEPPNAGWRQLLKGSVSSKETVQCRTCLPFMASQATTSIALPRWERGSIWERWGVSVFWRETASRSPGIQPILN
jgi:ligand-binding sensor domain-containing protein